jgi:hypothetical protein
MTDDIDNENKRLTGRPPRPIDWEQVDYLIMAQCNQNEVAAQFDMHPSTFNVRFQEKYGVNFTHYAQSFRSKGVNSIKAKMFNRGVKEGHMPALTKLFDTYVDEAKPHAMTGAPLDTSLDKDHENMALKNEILRLKDQLADKPQAG